IAALTLSALISAAPAFAQQTAAPSSGQSAQSSTSTPAAGTAAGKKHHRRHKKLGKELGLTADQKKQMKALREDQRKQIQAVRNDSSLSQDQKAAKLKDIHQSGMEKRDAILTAEQREKLQHLRDENEENEAGEHHHKRGMKSAQPPAPEQAP